MAQKPDPNSTLSPQIQNLIATKLKQAKHDGEQLQTYLNNNDVNGAITQACKLINCLSRDGVKSSDAGSGLYPSAFASTVSGAYTNGHVGGENSKNGGSNSSSHASLGIGNSTSQLLPSKAYYQLWIGITEQLEIFENYLLELTEKCENPNGSGTAEQKDLLQDLKQNLYIKVQYQETILSRLYLMTLVGSWLVKKKFENFRSTFEDLVEMAIGIQSSQRGLFLRAFILQKIRFFIKNHHDYNKIKNLDFIKIILINFGEMNKLWVRMQYLGHSKDSGKRVTERTHIRMLLGKNLVYMSELGDKKLTLEIYEYFILPEILKQAVGSKDKVAQDYLFECLIQVYNDNFHVATSDVFIKQLSSSVRVCDISTILPQFVERIQEQSLLDVKAGKNSAYYNVSKKARNKMKSDYNLIFHFLGWWFFKFFCNK